MSKTTNHSLGSWRDESAEVLSLGRETRDFFFPFFLQLYSQIHSLGISEVFVFSLV